MRILSSSHDELTRRHTHTFPGPDQGKVWVWRRVLIWQWPPKNDVTTTTRPSLPRSEYSHKSGRFLYPAPNMSQLTAQIRVAKGGPQHAVKPGGDLQELGDHAAGMMRTSLVAVKKTQGQRY